jgi:hypothetical protein
MLPLIKDEGTGHIVRQEADLHFGGDELHGDVIGHLVNRYGGVLAHLPGDAVQEAFYHICRTLDISADDCIFQDQQDRTSSTYQELLRLLSLCDEKSLSVLVATASALTGTNSPASLSDMEGKQT